MYSKIARVVFVLMLFVIFILAVSSGASGASVISPVQTPTPQNISYLKLLDPFYVENPPAISARRGSFVAEDGDLVLTQTVVAIPHHYPMIVNIKKEIPTSVSIIPQSVEPTVSNDVHVISKLTLQSPQAYPEIHLPIVYGANPTKVVYVIIYQGQTPSTTLGGGYPVGQSYEMAVSLTVSSKWHGIGDPSVRYGVYQYSPIIHYSYPPVQGNGKLNVQSIYNQEGLCQKIVSGTVDEIWIWTDGSHTYSSSEWSINGPSYSVDAGANLVPGCGKTVTTLYFNFDRSTASSMESYAHTFDSMLQAYWMPYQYEACDAVTDHINNWGGPQYIPQCTGQYAASDIYGLTSNPSATYNNNTGVCGDVHWPPNIPFQYWNEYDYSEPITNTSRCNNWQWNGGTTSQISCYTWGCVPCQDPYGSLGYFFCNEANEKKYLVWWMQHIPGLGNDSHGRSGTLRPNYWTIKFQ